MKIVAPAGNMERFYSAISATADEIYLGLKGFGARRNAENFTVEELKQAIDYAHLRGSRIFLTLNTIMTNREIELLYPTLKDLYNYGLDAIIVQDIGYAEYLHKNFPSIEIHGSTQMTVANYYEINYLKELGFKRIVLPRELSFEEIKEIRKNTDMELEVFVSGSLCISFSGNCYMSSFIGGIGEVVGKSIRLDEDVVSGDGITFVSKDYKNLGGTYINKIAYKNEKLILNFPDGTKYIFRNYNKRLNDEISKKIKSTDKKLEINFDFTAKLDEKLILKTYLEDENGNRILNLEEISETLTQKAQKRAISEEDINEKLSEIGDSEFTVKNIKIDIDENIFIPLSELKNLKRNAVEKFREKILSYFRRNLDSELKENNQEYFKLEIEKDEPKDLEIRVIISNEEQKNFLENIKNEYNIKEIYYRTYDIAKQSMLSQHNLDNKLASNLYELLENKNSAVMLNWNMNIVNSYTISVLEKIGKLESFIVSPEINFSKIRELGKTRLKKALLIYSKLKGMTIDIDIADNKNEVITNKENDKFNIIKNEYGTEIFLDKPLNIINIMEDIKKLNIDIVVLEFTTETIEDIKKVLKQLKTKKGEYREYNYKRGVY